MSKLGNFCLAGGSSPCTPANSAGTSCDDIHELTCIFPAQLTQLSGEFGRTSFPIPHCCFKGGRMSCHSNLNFFPARPFHSPASAICSFNFTDVCNYSEGLGENKKQTGRAWQLCFLAWFFGYSGINFLMFFSRRKVLNTMNLIWL